MPDEIAALTRRVDANERNHTDLAKSVTAIVEDQRSVREEINAIKIDREVRKVREEHLNERLDRIEDRIDDVYKLGRWVLTAFGASLLALLANFIFRGGLIGP